VKGTMLDFLKLVSEEPELAKGLAELAAKHDFEFSDEVPDRDLEAVAGGTLAPSKEMNIESVPQDDDASDDLQNALQRQQQTLQLMSNVSKMVHDASMSIIRKIGG